MANIKIKDLPKNIKITKEELKNVSGGLVLSSVRTSKLKIADPRLINLKTKSIQWTGSPFGATISCW